VFEFFSGRLSENLDARFQNVVGVGKPKLRAAAAEKPAEHVVKIFLDSVVSFQKQSRSGDRHQSVSLRQKSIFKISSRTEKGVGAFILLEDVNSILPLAGTLTFLFTYSLLSVSFSTIS